MMTTAAEGMPAARLDDRRPTPRCLHCGSSHARLLLRYREQETFLCRDCRGCFNRPPADVGRAYTSSYYETVYASRMAAQAEQSRQYLQVIRRHTSGRTLLDYGCGSGVFMATALEEGFAEVAGADISPAALKSARQNVGEAATLIDLSRDPLPARRFGVVAILDTLSAVPDARAVLERLKEQHLAEDGVFVLRTPNIPRSYVLLIRALTPFIGKKQASRFLFAENRYALFDTRSLNRLLASVGLEPVVVEIGDDLPLIRPPVVTWYDRAFVVLRALLRRRSIFALAVARPEPQP